MSEQTHQIRTAEPEDIAALVTLENRVFVPADGLISRRAFRYHLKKGNLLLIATQGSHEAVVSGYVLAFVRNKSARIYSLATAPEFRQQGIAKNLLAECIKRLGDMGIGCITLELRITNSSARKLYQSFGFIEYKVRSNYYADGESALCMHLQVDGVASDNGDGVVDGD